MSAQRKTALITGAAGHLGRAVTQNFHAQGLRLVLMDQHAETLIAAFSHMSDTLPIAVDLRERAQVGTAVEQAVARFGGIDVWCHIAGGFRMGEPVHETSDTTWDFLMDLNARTLVHVAHAVVPNMLARGGGKIIAIGAGAAQRGGAQMGAYSASKSALIRLTESMSAELKDKGVNVNCVLPSIIDTPANRAAMPKADASRWVRPEALAEVIAFLASDGARAIHGASINVTGLV